MLKVTRPIETFLTSGTRPVGMRYKTSGATFACFSPPCFTITLFTIVLYYLQTIIMNGHSVPGYMLRAMTRHERININMRLIINTTSWELC